MGGFSRRHNVTPISKLKQQRVTTVGQTEYFPRMILLGQGILSALLITSKRMARREKYTKLTFGQKQHEETKQLESTDHES